MKIANFNPRSPCGERRCIRPMIPWTTTFQSTLPVWGATVRISVGSFLHDYFNPRSPCGERRAVCADGLPRYRFQSTLPVWGATKSMIWRSIFWTFQSTLPVWGATRFNLNLFEVVRFQSTLPVWGATYCRKRSRPESGCRFQSTLPVWGATLPNELKQSAKEISIHAPRVGSDQPRDRG